MIELGIARRYVRALFELALEAGGDTPTKVLSDLQWLDQTLASEDLGRFVADPRVSVQEKRETLERVLPDSMTPAARDFVLWATGRGRAAVLQHAASEFELMWLDHQSVHLARVTSATPLDDAARADLEQKLAGATGGKVQLETDTDPELLGGLRIQIGSTLFDGSLRRSLADAKAELLKARLPEPEPMTLGEA